MRLIKFSFITKRGYVIKSFDFLITNSVNAMKKAAILLSGGSGMRFGSALPKQFHRMSGKPIYLYTLETFLATKEFDTIILPVPKEWEEEVSSHIHSLNYQDIVTVISGGITRQDSSYLALLACPTDTDYVVIHDAVRPFVSKKIIQDNLKAVFIHKAVDTCISSTDTIVHSKTGDWLDEIPMRKEFLRGQTPQSFHFELILKAHKEARLNNIENASDDCSLVLRLGEPIKIVLGEDLNIKITTELDLFLAEQILSRAKPESEYSLKTPLKGKYFAVTGATGGIGKALCKELSRLGATPLEISQTATFLQADLTKHAEVENLFKTIADIYGPIDGLINSVGTFQVKHFEALSEEEIQQTIHSNLTSVIYCCRYAQIKQGGHIVNISSSSYSKGRKDSLIYSASKAAVVNFTQGLAEVRPDLYVNVVVPQRTDTLLRRSQYPSEDQNSLIKPEEIAEKISSLLEHSGYTGSILEVRKKYPKA